MPDASYFVSYWFISGNSNAPITNLRIDLQDAYRTVTVEGNNPEQVDALFSLLKDEMENYSVVWGGPKFRLWSGVLFFLLFCLIPSLLVLVASEISPKIVGVRLVIGVLVIAAVQLILIFVLPFDKWLPGFVVYEPNSSFIIKYSALFTFLSFIAIPIAWIGTLLIKGVKRLVGNRQENEQKMVRIESKLETTLQRVEEIKRNPPIASPGELSVIEEEMRRLADEFFNTRDAKTLFQKRSNLDLEVREAGLNAEWRPKYLLIIETLRMMISSYNEKLEENEKITFQIADLPSNIFSLESNKYSGMIDFANGVKVKLSIGVNRPINVDKLPYVFFRIKCEADDRRDTIVNISFDPLERSLAIRRLHGDDIEIREREAVAIDGKYPQIIIDFLRSIIEPQLVS